MCKNKFGEAISPHDTRLKEPHLAVNVFWENDGPKLGLIGRHNFKKHSDGTPLLDAAGKPVYDIWYDLPGGKRDPIYDGAVIRGLESGENAAKRETEEEVGLFIDVGFKIGQCAAPMKPDLTRHFYEARQLGGKFENKVPNEHLFVFVTDTENAIDILGSRIPEEVRSYIREKARQLTVFHTNQSAPQNIAV